MSKNVILVDNKVDDNWEYKVAIEEMTGENWDILHCVLNKLRGNKFKVLLRYVGYFWFSFYIFLKRKNYKTIIAWQQFYGLLLVFFCRLFKVKQIPDIYIMTFIFKPKKISIYNKLINYIVTSGYIKKMIVISDSERQYYSKLFNISEDIFYCTRIGVPDISEKVTHKKNVEKYYLSVGRSNRDYSFLNKVWKSEYGKLIVISDSYKEPDKEGIVCLKKCYGNDYIQMLADCYAVIISLKDPNISSGSLSFLQAMMLSKPVIVTDNETVHSYIKSGYSGYIIQKDELKLYKAICELEDEENYKRISDNARRAYVNYFSEYSLGIDVGKMIRGICEK